MGKKTHAHKKAYKVTVQECTSFEGLTMFLLNCTSGQIHKTSSLRWLYDRKAVRQQLTETCNNFMD
jgi:hypothetical protein